MIYTKIFGDLVLELKKSGIKSAEIDAQVLLEFVTKKTREFLLANPEYKLKNQEIEELKNLVERRKKHEPIAYLVGHKEFYGLDFEVTKDVLIPRPETEILVEEVLNYIKIKELKNRKTIRILDVGTGSGNIIISIAKLCKKFSIANFLHFFASDISETALVVAKENTKKHKVDIIYVQSNLFDNINRKFDLIIANLPYVPNGGSNDKEVEHEPLNAIFAGDNGTEIIKRFLTDAKKYINKNGLILIELDPRNALGLKKYASKLYKSAELKKDFSGIYRLLLILT